MLVATVTAPGRPAWVTMWASRSWAFAFSTWCGMPRRSSMRDSSSDFSTEIVPTSTGWPASWRSSMSSAVASNFASLGLVDEVGLVVADHRAVGGHRHDLEAVGVGELAGLGGRGARHARELLVHAEVVLERDRGEGLVLLLDPHPLLGLDRLVQALAPATTLEDAAGELVDDLHLALLHHVVDVALEQLLGAQRGLELVHVVLVHVLVEVVDLERVARPARRLPRSARPCASPRRPRSRGRA